MRLPNVARAEVDLRKLSEYCPCPTHPVGKHKAAVFRAALGLNADDAAMLRQRLLQAAADVEAVSERADKFGERYRIDFELATPTGRALVPSAWIIRAGENFPRLTTCFVLPNRGIHGNAH